jgi:condensin-2 complex subunit D3
MVQALIASSLKQIDTADQRSNNNNRKEVTIASSVRAHAFVALGKMCLNDEALAKKSVPLFITEMEKSKDESVRNNILVIMCDLCVRYTSVVDRYVAKISESMCDKSNIVRRNATVLLTQILAEDFIKWKPLLLFRFLAVLNDCCTVIAKSAEYALLNILPRKHSNLLFHHTIEAIFVLNNCTTHPTYNSFVQNDREIALFTSPGGDMANVKKRFLIYKFLLAQLTSEQKLQVSSKLHTEVLSMFAEETIPIHKHVLSDVINLLSWPEFKFSKARIGNDDPNLSEEANEVVSDVRGKLLGTVLKKHMTENVVPIIIELKRTLEKRRSPLLKQLMLYLQLILSEYKSEIKDMLVNDKQLAKEIEFDMRRIEQIEELSRTPSRRLSGKVPFQSPRSRISNVDSPLSAAVTPSLKKHLAQQLHTNSVTKKLFQDEEEEEEDEE